MAMIFPRMNISRRVIAGDKSLTGGCFSHPPRRGCNMHVLIYAIVAGLSFFAYVALAGSIAGALP